MIINHKPLGQMQKAHSNDSPGPHQSVATSGDGTKKDRQKSVYQAMLQAAGRVEAKVVRQYVWGARPGHRDELIRRDDVMEDASGSSSESPGSTEPVVEQHWCLMDYYDPTSIVDNTGSVVERYGFSAFGLRNILTPEFSPRVVSHYDWNFAFKGQFLDLESGFYNYGYRSYSPKLGRWLSRDPIGEKGGLNLYGMARNNSMNRIDRLGLLTCTCKCDDKQAEVKDKINQILRAIMEKSDLDDAIDAWKQRVLSTVQGLPSPLERALTAAVKDGTIEGTCTKDQGFMAGFDAPVLRLCGRCVGIDKIGHFFEVGYWQKVETDQRGPGAGHELGRHLEGMSASPGSPYAQNPVTGGWHGDWGPGGGNFGDKPLDPNGSASPADLSANDSGEDFWNQALDPEQYLPYFIANFDICSFVNDGWDHTKNPNIPGTSRGTNPGQLPGPAIPGQFGW